MEETTAAPGFAMLEPPVHAPEWRACELRVPVPEEADAVTLGFVLAGNGRAWLRRAWLEVSGGA